MTSIELERFRVILEARLKELGSPLSGRGAIAAEERNPDPADDSAAENGRAIAIKVLGDQSAQARLIASALQRIKLGEFGRCLCCELPIAPARLEIRPWEPLCTPCQDAIEELASMPPRGMGAAIGFSHSCVEELP